MAPPDTNGLDPLAARMAGMRIEEALAFDDVLIVPGYSLILPSGVSTQTKLTRDIALHIPLVSSAMDGGGDGKRHGPARRHRRHSQEPRHG